MRRCGECRSCCSVFPLPVLDKPAGLLSVPGRGPDKQDCLSARAQAAYQQAMYLVRALPRLQRGEPVSPFVFRDQGSLVSLSEYSSVGSLMGSLTKGSFFIEGQLAKIMYWALHKQHQLALGGWKKTALITLSEMIDRTYRPRIKLH